MKILEDSCYLYNSKILDYLGWTSEERWIKICGTTSRFFSWFSSQFLLSLPACPYSSSVFSLLLLSKFFFYVWTEICRRFKTVTCHHLWKSHFWKHGENEWESNIQKSWYPEEESSHPPLWWSLTFSSFSYSYHINVLRDCNTSLSFHLAVFKQKFHPWGKKLSPLGLLDIYLTVKDFVLCKSGL